MSFTKHSNFLIKKKQKFSFQNLDADPEIEKCLIQVLADISPLLLPINSKQLINKIEKIQLKSVPNESLLYFLKKAAGQGLISIKEVSINNEMGYEVIQIERTGITTLFNDMLVGDKEIKIEDSLKRKCKNF